MNEPLDPPDEPDYTCDECGGSGTLEHPSDPSETIVCPVCKGHGSMEEEIASCELERQIQAQSDREASEGYEL